MQDRANGRRRPVVLDADEWEYLPEEVYIPLRRRSVTNGRAQVELREMTDSRIVLLVYSSMERLIAALGDSQVAMKRSAADLPRLRRQLNFQAVLLDVMVPEELITRPTSESEKFRPLPLIIDASSGEPMVFVPSRPCRRGDGTAQVELQKLADGRVVMLTYSSLAALADGCGPHQRYVSFPAGQLEKVRRLAGADAVLIDTPLPASLRHSH